MGARRDRSICELCEVPLNLDKQKKPFRCAYSALKEAHEALIGKIPRHSGFIYLAGLADELFPYVQKQIKSKKYQLISCKSFVLPKESSKSEIRRIVDYYVHSNDF
jgi:hypothetical protein